MSRIFSKRSLAGVLATAALVSAVSIAPARAAGEAIELERMDWTFGGLTGHFDKEQLRRGYMVYKNVCAACHGVRQLYFRNLSEPGGPQFSEARVNEFAAEALVRDGPNDDGEMFERAGLPADKIPSPYPNDKAAAAAQGGVVPPDLSLMTKARAVASAGPWYMEPFHWVYDVATVYQEEGADYLHALLTGYPEEPPEGVEVLPGMYYNTAFPGHQIAMPPPLVEGVVEYADGTAPTVENYSRDVTAFLMWAAEPKLEERKRMGLKVLLYLAILSLLLFLSKRALWRNVEH
jgi:cytochrome c1